jgi:hypothetical protein
MGDWRTELWARKRIREVADGTEKRFSEMERQDPNPDDGAIEVGTLKEPKT